MSDDFDDDFDDEWETEAPKSDFIKAEHMFGTAGVKGNTGRLMIIWPTSFERTTGTDPYDYAVCNVAFLDGGTIDGLIETVPSFHTDVRFSAGRQASMLISRLKAGKRGPVVVRSERQKGQKNYSYGFAVVTPDEIEKAKSLWSKIKP